jgi:hypothetical protein
MTAPPLKLVHNRDRKWTPDIAEAEFRRWHKHFRDAMLGTDGKKPSDFDEAGRPGPLGNWNRPHDLASLKRAAQAAANLGILTRDNPVADVDCPNPRVADAVEAATAAVLGLAGSALPVRWRDDSPKRAIMFALKSGAAPFKKMSVSAIDANGQKQTLEILADGQQSVWAGVHPDGALLKIRGPHPADGENRPEIDEHLARRILDASAAAMVREGCKLAGKNEGASAQAASRKPRLREECDRFEYVNDQALLNKANILKWAADLLPGGEETGDGYAIWPNAMGRDGICEERVSIVPAGLQDFGQDWGEGRVGYTAIDFVQAFSRKDESGDLVPVDEFDDKGAPIGGSVSREDAAAYLCECLNIDWEAEIAKDVEQMQRDFGGKAYEKYVRENPAFFKAEAAKAEQAAKAEPAGKHIALEFPDELEQPGDEVSDFVEDILCDGQISVLFGESNVGKTFLALDLALHVANGWPWHGREVDRGGAVYIAGEGASGAKQRYAAFRKHHGREKTAGAWFAMVPRAVDFRDKASVGALISAVNDAAPRLGARVRLIVVDTVSRALAGGDENSSVDMGALVAAADRLRLATEAHVMLIHHAGKDASKGARGHSLLRGNVDTEIAIERGDADHTVVMRVTKQRDLECGGPFSFRLRQVRLGTNRRGKPITSCVVETAEMPRPKLSEKSSTCLLILNEMLPEDVSEADEASHLGVKIEAWRDAVMRRLEEGGVASASTRRNDFKRAKEALLSGGYITISGDLVNVPW